MTLAPKTLRKAERISSKKSLDSLFQKGNRRSMVAYPLRMVYQTIEKNPADSAVAQMMVSVPKRHFKHAVDRNRAKRQVREAYRHNKATLLEELQRLDNGIGLRMAFLWMDNQQHPSHDVARSMKSLICRLAERLQKPQSPQT